MPDERNFRFNYLEKVGVKSAIDVKKNLAVLLNECPLDKVKLAHFGLKYELPGTERIEFWKVLLDVTPLNSAASKFVRDQQHETYNSLLFCLSVIRAVRPIEPLSEEIEINGSVLTKMFLLEEGKLGFNPDRQIQESAPKEFLSMAEVVRQISSNSVDAYFLTKGVFKLIRLNEDKLAALARTTDTVISQKFPHICSLCQRLDVDISVLGWYRTLFSSTFSPEIIVRLWDRVICGAFDLLKYTSLSLLFTLKGQLLGARTSAEFWSILSNVPSETQVSIYQRAFDNWETGGRNLWPTESRTRSFTIVTTPKQRSRPALVTSRTLQAS